MFIPVSGIFKIKDFKIICLALFTIQSLQSSFMGNYVSAIDFIYCRNLIYLTYGKIWLILYTVWGLASSVVLGGVGIISSQVFSHLGSFKGWIQTEARVSPSYHGMLILWEKQI